MRRRPLLHRMLARFLLACLLVSSVRREAAANDRATPWEQAYVDGDAAGPDVIGLWKFDDDDRLDATGTLPAGELLGARLVPEGRFGGSLESFAGFPDADRSHGFVVPHHRRLTPAGAFTVELWLKPKVEFADRDWAVIVDKKYAGHDDYQLSFGPPDAEQQRQLTLSLGFGTESQDFLSAPGVFAADEWVHVAATYDGKGSVHFYRNGTAFGGMDVPGRGAVSAGSLPWSIGDRLGSNFPGFPGFVDEVRLTAGVREFGPLRLTFEWPRRAFVRFEPAPEWSVTVTNLRPEPVAGAMLSIAVGPGTANFVDLPTLEPGEAHTLTQMFDTRLRPDTYMVSVAASLASPSSPAAPPASTAAFTPDVVASVPVVLVPRPLPERMPVVMWGIGGVEGVITELPRLKQLGFTHCFGGEVDHQKVADANAPILVIAPERMPATIEMLDAALAGDLRILADTWPGYFEPAFEEYVQVGRGGTPLTRRSLTPNAHAVMEAFERAGDSIALTYAGHPAFAGVSVNTEVRDESEVSFTEWDLNCWQWPAGASRRRGP